MYRLDKHTILHECRNFANIDLILANLNHSRLFKRIKTPNNFKGYCTEKKYNFDCETGKGDFNAIRARSIPAKNLTLQEKIDFLLLHLTLREISPKRLIWYFYWQIISLIVSQYFYLAFPCNIRKNPLGLFFQRELFWRWSEEKRKLLRCQSGGHRPNRRHLLKQ